MIEDEKARGFIISAAGCAAVTASLLLEEADRTTWREKTVRDLWRDNLTRLAATQEGEAEDHQATCASIITFTESFVASLPPDIAAPWREVASEKAQADLLVVIAINLGSLSEGNFTCRTEKITLQ